MVKNYSKRSKTRKSLIAALCAVTVTCTGLAAACADNDDPEKPTTEKPTDTQVLKNGNFEFYNTPDEEKAAEGKAIYLIKDADSWTRNGDSSNTKSGVIATSESAWEKLAAEDLADKLAYNSDLSTTSDEYIDYNGMRARDVLYKDTYAALLADDEVKDSYIKYQSFADYFGIVKYNDNYYMNAVDNGDGTYNVENATRVYIAAETDPEDWKSAEFFLDDGLEKPVRKQLIENPETHYGSYRKEGDDKHFLGTTEVFLDEDGNYFLDEDLEKPCSNILMVHNYPTDSKYNGISQYYSSQSVSLPVNTAAEISVWVKTSDLKFDKGYSQLEDQDRGAFIEVTQTVGGSTLDSFKIKAINTEKILRDNPALDTNNGWLKYTVYVNACDFAASTVSINVGLGQSENNEKCTGYAFFDDIEVTTASSLEKLDNYSDDKAKITDNTTCTLSSEGDEKIFIADREIRGGKDNARNSTDFFYLLDLASENGTEGTYTPYELNGAAGGNVTAGLTTQDSGKNTYVSSKTMGTNLVNVQPMETDYANCDIPANLKNNERDTANDLIGLLGADETFSYSMFSGRDYSARLNGALTGDNGFNKLPTYEEGNKMLVVLSAYGAAYTAKISGFTLAANGEDGDHAIISFWIKTSDMNGSTAATVRVTDLNGEDVSDNLSVDTTNVKTKIDDDEDAYNGWVQCFFFVKNDTKAEKNFNLEFRFGNTALAETAASDYNYGWIALANVQTMEVPEKIYDVASDGSYLKTYSFTTEDETEQTKHKFDEASGTSDIKKGFAKPSSYYGVNGASSSVSDNNYDEAYDARNVNTQAGLINPDTDEAVLNAIYSAFGEAVTSWNEVFGDSCYQPLIIVNNLREYGEKQVYNYGFIGTNSTVSSNSYQTVSVRVKVSEGAKAYLYLVDTDTREVLKYATPSYTFFYDDEGNVLSEKYDEEWTTAEHREKIVYTLRTDGLYEDKDGKIYANLYNLTKSYKYYKYEHNIFYNAQGEQVSFDDLVNGETYYRDANHTTLANHFLTNTDGERVYEYYDDGYYYLVEGERGVKVNDFDKSLARYDNSDYKQEMMVEVGPTGGKWKTVNFVIHTGSQAKNYRVELWSGKRDEAGEASTGAIAFDYSAYSVTESNYSTVTQEYTDKIIRAYKNLLRSAGKLDEIPTNDENVEFYENLVAQLRESGDITDAQYNNANIPAYTADYFAYTLYDSAAYSPFNADVAGEGETGYDYSITNDISAEKLGYFRYEDEELNSTNVFVDYSSVDQTVTKTTVDDGDDDDDDDGDTDSNAGELALYISSIILVVVLLIALVSLLLRDFLKKYAKTRGNKATAKNNYRQRERYIKKLHLVKTEEAENSEAPEAPADNAETQPEEAEEPATVEESPEEESSEENPSEETTPAEETTETTDEAVEENKDGSDEQ